MINPFVTGFQEDPKSFAGGTHLVLNMGELFRFKYQDLSKLNPISHA